MMEDEYKEEQIIMYLEGGMNDLDKSAFEISLKSDPELQQLLEEYKIILFGVESWGEQQLKNSIKEVHTNLANSDFFQKTNSNPQNPLLLKFNRTRYLAIAAILSGIIITVLLYPFANKNKGDELFTQYYKKDTAWINIILSQFSEVGYIPETQNSDSFLIALQQYRSGDYHSSIQILKRINPDSSVVDLKLHLLGLNYMGVNDWTKAEECFSALCEKADTSLKQESCWQNALVRTKLNQDKDKTIDLLQNIIQSNSKYSMQAKSLLKQLK